MRYVKNSGVSSFSSGHNLCLSSSSSNKDSVCVLEGGAAIAVWRFLEKPRSREEIVELLLKQFEGNKTEIERDALELLFRLRDEGFISESASLPGRPVPVRVTLRGQEFLEPAPKGITQLRQKEKYKPIEIETFNLRDLLPSEIRLVATTVRCTATGETTTNASICRCSTHAAFDEVSGGSDCCI